MQWNYWILVRRSFSFVRREIPRGKKGDFALVDIFTSSSTPTESSNSWFFLRLAIDFYDNKKKYAILDDNGEKRVNTIVPFVRRHPTRKIRWLCFSRHFHIVQWKKGQHIVQRRLFYLSWDAPILMFIILIYTQSLKCQAGRVGWWGVLHKVD